MGKFRGLDTKEGWIIRRFKALEKDVRELRAARRLESSSVTGGVRTIIEVLTDPSGTLLGITDTALCTGPGPQDIILTRVPIKGTEPHVHWRTTHVPKTDWVRHGQVVTVQDPTGSSFAEDDPLSCSYLTDSTTAFPPPPSAVISALRPDTIVGNYGLGQDPMLTGNVVDGDTMWMIALLRSSTVVVLNGWTLEFQSPDQTVNNTSGIGDPTFTFSLQLFSKIADGSTGAPEPDTFPVEDLEFSIAGAFIGTGTLAWEYDTAGAVDDAATPPITPSGVRGFGQLVGDGGGAIDVDSDLLYQIAAFPGALTVSNPADNGAVLGHDTPGSLTGDAFWFLISVGMT